MNQFEMYFPETFDEAVRLLSETGGKPIAGGTALTTLMKERVLQPEVLVNLRSLEQDHSFIEAAEDEVRIGALSTLRSIETSSAIAEHVPLVGETLSKVASVRIRTVATIGGNLAHADPDLDLPPVLAGLDAEIVIHGPDGERSCNINEFIQDYYQTALGAHELIKEVRIPVRPTTEGVYHKHRSLSEADWPCVGVAAFIHDGGVPEVYLNSVADTPIFQLDGLDEIFADGLTEAAIGRAGDAAREQCDPVGDPRGSAWYKREMAKEFTERALRDVSGVGTERVAPAQP